MSRRKRWVSFHTLTIALMMVLGSSLSSVVSAQEARWEELHSQVDSLYQQGKYREAIPLAKESLKVAEQTFGQNHPHVATGLNNLAALYMAQGRYAQAEPLFKRALMIMEKTVPNHPDVAILLNSMAALYTKTGRDDEAKKLLARAKRIRAGQ